MFTESPAVKYKEQIVEDVYESYSCITCLLCSIRPDGHQNNLRSAAYEALMEIVKNSAKDCYPAVQKTTLVIMKRLQQVLQMEVSSTGRANRMAWFRSLSVGWYKTKHRSEMNR